MTGTPVSVPFETITLFAIIPNLTKEVAATAATSFADSATSGFLRPGGVRSQEERNLILMRIAVCEDNKIQREMIVYLLNRCSCERSLPVELVPYEYGMNFLYDMEEGSDYDVVFLDIYLQDVMGNEIAHRLRAMGYQGKIVFLTASPDFAIESYDVAASGYLLKPINYERLKTVVDRITEGFAPNTYQIRHRATVTKLPHREILYIESSNSKCMIHTVHGGVHTAYKTLSTIEQELDDPCFLRCHQSFLVNMNHVKQIGKEFLLSNGERIPIRQRGVKTVRQTYIAYAAALSAAH